MRVEGDLLARGALRLRGLRDEACDYDALAAWLSDDRVLRWYGGRDAPMTREEVLRKYRPRLRAEDPVRPCIIERTGAPVGYLQFYPVGKASDQGLEDAEASWAVDLFLGEPSQWSQGVGSELLAALVEYLCAHAGAERIVIDPQVSNARAIRCYEKAGFRKRELLREHELHEGELRDHWLMVCEVGMRGPTAS